MMSWQDDPLVSSSWENDPVVELPDAMYRKQAKADTNKQNLMASIGGAMYAPYLGAKELLGKATPQEVADWKNSMSGLWSTPMGKVGTVAGGATAAVPLAMLPGANTLAGAALTGAAYGGLQPVGEDGNRLLNTGMGAAGGAVGKVGGDWIANKLTGALANNSANLAAQRIANAPRDATLAEAKGAGYVIPPTQANPQAPGMLNRFAEGLSGKIQTGQLASIKNQAVTDKLAKSALSLPESVPITPGAIKDVRTVAGKFYEQAKNMGPYVPDEIFDKAISGATAEYSALAKQFPSQRIGAVDSLVKDLQSNTLAGGKAFDGSAAVNLVRRLRKDGFSNIKSMEPEKQMLGQVQLSAQNAIEDLMQRRLEEQGQVGFVQAFKKARELIAKSHTVENALEESTGKIVAGKIGREFSKGRPLTGDLATIGRTAEAFPKAVQNVNSSMPGLSPLDVATSAITGAAALGSGHPQAAWLAAVPVLRPIARSAILSKPWQSAMVNAPSYETGLLSKALPKAAQSEYAKRLEQALLTSLFPRIQQ